MSKKLLIIGSTGFIGSELLKYLKKYEITAIVRKKPRQIVKGIR